MERPRAAESDERQSPRVDAALDRHDPQRPCHVGVHDLDDASRVEVAKRPLGQRSVEDDLAAEDRPVREVAEDEIASVTVGSVPPRP